MHKENNQDTGRRERKRHHTMDHLAAVAWAMFENEGYDAVTMEAIAAAADVAKGTLYKYFPVKEALLRHHFHGGLARQIPALLAELAALPNAAMRLRTFFEKSAEWSIRYRQYLGPYLRLRMTELGAQYDRNSPNRSGMEQVFTAMVEDGQRSGEFRRDIDTTSAAHYLAFLHLAALLRWINCAHHDLHAEFQTILDLYLKGITS